MKVLDEYILVVVFMLLLKRVYFLANKTQSCDHSNIDFDEYLVTMLFILLLKTCSFPCFLLNEIKVA